MSKNFSAIHHMVLSQIVCQHYYEGKVFSATKHVQNIEDLSIVVACREEIRPVNGWHNFQQKAER